MHFERHISPFKMHKIIYFPEKLKKFYVSPVNLGTVGLPFLFGINSNYYLKKMATRITSTKQNQLSLTNLSIKI